MKQQQKNLKTTSIRCQRRGVVSNRRVLLIPLGPLIRHRLLALARQVERVGLVVRVARRQQPFAQVQKRRPLVGVALPTVAHHVVQPVGTVVGARHDAAVLHIAHNFIVAPS